MPGPIPIAPVLYIGLGGLGQSSLAATKRRMLETYGSIPPMVRFLALDSAPLAHDAAAVLDVSEFLHLQVADVAAYRAVAGDFLEPWMDFEHLDTWRFSSIRSGAGQIRMIGRLALLHSLAGPVLTAVDRARAEIVRWGGGDNRFSRSSAGPQVVLIGSLAGGTGAGALIDLAAALRSRPDANGWSLAGYMALPGVYRGHPRTDLVDGNAFAFLKELDYLQGNARAIATHEVESPESFEVDLGSMTYSLAAPFDSLVFVDNVSSGQVVYRTPDDIAQAIATELCEVSGADGRPITESLADCGRFEVFMADALPGLDQLRNAYEDHVSRPDHLPLHLDKRWDALLPEIGAPAV